MYFIHLKVLREYSSFSPCAKPLKWIKFLVVKSWKDALQIPVNVSLGK